jgi:hypothetical protein
MCIWERAANLAAAVYIMDAQFMSDRAKFFAGTLSALSAMIRLEIPHINVLSKMDLLGRHKRSRDMERYATCVSVGWGHASPWPFLRDISHADR